MLVYDPLYGEQRITDHILVDIMHTKAMQRLKGVAQFGMPDEWYHIKGGFSRYEHSIGVMLLLDRLNSSLKERVAGLLHDVSHTAFSHVVDWVYGSEAEEDFQDRIFSKFIDSPVIRNILKMYGYDSADFHDLRRFTLLEQELPELCADRMDYFLRELKMMGRDVEVEQFLHALVNVDRRMYVRDEKSAIAIAKAFNKMQKDHWGSLQARNRYRILADILILAKDENIINFDDLLTEDRLVMEKLRNSKNKEILAGIKKLENGKFEIDENLGKKLRYLDPLYFTERRIIKRLSLTNFEFAEELDKLKNENSE